MELKTTLNEEMTKRYGVVKEHTGMSDNKNVLAFLISKEYSRIQRSKRHKVFLPNETYNLELLASMDQHRSKEIIDWRFCFPLPLVLYVS